MNGIIHNCTHKDDELKAQLTEREMILKIFRYIDQLFQLIQPSKYFFLALDGVAPRAKMNQQRSRRFRKVFDAEQLRKKMEKKAGEAALPEKDDVFDSNCITPGTEFMAKLSEHLKYFIHSKMQNDVKWQQCKVILSGHEVPGEGEHKIMNFIRGRKSQPGYEPNERHCLYGLDADLICLGLVTHEPHFMLLREDVFDQYRQKDSKEKDKNKPFAEKFHLLHLYALRQYLDFEFREALLGQKLSFAYDLERVIDDFVFFIFFTGNDFLPHMPTLDIKEGSINTMIEIYKKVLPSLSGYLTDLGDIHFDRVEQFVRLLADQESSMMEQRYNARLRENRKTRRRRRGRVMVDSEGFKSVSATAPLDEVDKKQPLTASGVLSTLENDVSPGSLKNELKQQASLFEKDGDEQAADMGVVVGVSNLMDFDAPTAGSYGVDEPLEDDEEEGEHVDIEEVNDLLLQSINENGFDFQMWHRAYYQTKMGINYDNKEEVAKVVRSYIEGLLWVFKYYYNQLISWRWFYPFHYAPIATDLVHMGEIAKDVQFTDPGTPFHPFEQLLGVLPEGSSKILPAPFRKLYLSSSPIYDFYPTEFVIDREGTRYDYEGVSLLPFIDEKRLLNAIVTVSDSELTEAEKKRNQFGHNFLFTFDNSVDVVCKSSLENELPDIAHSHVKEEIIEFPAYAKFLPTLCKDVKLGKKNLEGFPVLECKPSAKVEEKDVGVALFGQPSRKPSLVVNLSAQYNKDQLNDDDFLIEESVKTTQQLRKLIGKKVYVGYPYPRIGILSSLADERACYYDESGEPEYHSERDAEQFRKEYAYQKNVLLRRYGLEIGNVRVLVFIKLFKGMKRDQYGIKKSFHKDEFAYPHNLMMLPEEYHPTLDKKFMESGPQAIEKEFPIGKTVLILGEENWGSIGQVSGYEKGSVKVNLTNPHSDSEVKPTYPKEIMEKFSSEKYYPFYQAAKKLQMSKKALGLIVGQLRLELTNGKLTPNVGLGLRSKKSTKRIVGYCRCDFNEQNLDEAYFLNFETGANLFSKPLQSKFSVGGVVGDWELSDKALQLVTDFASAFPEFMQKLADDIPFRCADFFPNTLKDNEKDKYYQSKVSEITKWIDAQEYRSLPFLDIEKDVFPKDVLQEIEKASLAFKPAEQAKETVTVVVPGHLLHRPEDPCPNLYYVSDFHLGNRIMYMSGTGSSAKFGAKGILVGIDGEKGEVIFDEEFVGGSTFGSRLTSSRGGIVSLRNIINFDKKKVVRSGNDSNQNKNFSKPKSDYTKQHYFNVSSYNYDLPKINNNEKQVKVADKNATPQQQQPREQKPPRKYQDAGKKQPNNGGQNFKILMEPGSAEQQHVSKHDKPKHEKRRQQQQAQQQAQQGTPQQQATEQVTAPSAGDDYNPSAVFLKSRANHKKERQQRPTPSASSSTTQPSSATNDPQEFLRMLKEQK